MKTFNQLLLFLYSFNFIVLFCSYIFFFLIFFLFLCYIFPRSHDFKCSFLMLFTHFFCFFLQKERKETVQNAMDRTLAAYQSINSSSSFEIGFTFVFVTTDSILSNSTRSRTMINDHKEFRSCYYRRFFFLVQIRSFSLARYIYFRLCFFP